LIFIFFHFLIILVFVVVSLSSFINDDLLLLLLFIALLADVYVTLIASVKLFIKKWETAMVSHLLLAVFTLMKRSFVHRTFLDSHFMWTELMRFSFILTCFIFFSLLLLQIHRIWPCNSIQFNIKLINLFLNDFRNIFNSYWDSTPNLIVLIEIFKILIIHAVYLVESWPPNISYFLWFENLIVLHKLWILKVGFYLLQ